MKVCTIVTLALAAGTATADTNPRMGGPMKHIMVHLHGNRLHCHVDESIPTPILRDYDESYTGAASVLDGQRYNAQYGWMVDGVWVPPEGSTLMIRQVGATPGIRVYSGRSLAGMSPFSPIFGTAESSDAIEWSGTMLHNWYAVEQAGNFSVTCLVYFADAQGNPLPGYETGSATLNWSTSDLCGADFDRDGFIDFFDLDAFVACFDAGICPAGVNPDVNADGFIDFLDFDAFLQIFESGC